MINYDYKADYTGDMTDYLSIQFDKDLKWHEGHLNGLPLLEMMKALNPLITTDIEGTFYISNNDCLDIFKLTRNDIKWKHTYKITMDEEDLCIYYITKIR